MRTLAGCLTLDRDPLIFKSFERNTVQVFWGDPFEKMGGGGTVGSAQAEHQKLVWQTDRNVTPKGSSQIRGPMAMSREQPKILGMFLGM